MRGRRIEFGQTGAGFRMQDHRRDNVYRSFPSRSITMEPITESREVLFRQPTCCGIDKCPAAGWGRRYAGIHRDAIRQGARDCSPLGRTRGARGRIVSRSDHDFAVSRTTEARRKPSLTNRPLPWGEPIGSVRKPSGSSSAL